MTKYLKTTTCVTLIFISASIMAISGTFLYLAPNLPEVEKLTDIKLQIPLRVYTSDGQLLGEFGDKRRNPIKYPDVPEQFIQAFLAAEDDQFYEHSGVSLKGMARAVFQMLSGSSTQTGGSTITMQVAKNYFLTPERTIIRKLREIFLAIQIEQQLEKNEILELYINKIFLGNRAYGIGAAAQVYYGKPTQELTLAQMAMIAGLPKAPSDFNPIANPERALLRRDWILKRMLKLHYIDEEVFKEAIAQPITAERHDVNIAVNAPYAAEMARRYALKNYGDNVYTEGYRVITTINGNFQKAANSATFNGLTAYDARHGLKEKEGKLENLEEETKKAFFKDNRSFAGIEPVIVIDSDDTSITAERENGEIITLTFTQEDFNNYRKYIDENTKQAAVKKASELASALDIIRVRQVGQSFILSQIPEAEAALVALSPKNGAILSMVGGFDFYKSKFDRSTQAARQVGSTIKPFIYAAAINNGFTPATIINDAPVVFDDDQLEGTWRPESADKKFLGPTRLRKALYLSRNLVSIRILRQTGIEKTRNYISQFGLGKYQLPKDLSLALGSSAYSPLDMAQAYATFANGGYAIKPFLINEVYNGNDEQLYKADPLLACDENCETLFATEEITALEEQSNENPEAPIFEEATTIEELDLEPVVYKKAPRIINEKVAFLMDDILKDVIRRGTGYKARSALNRKDIAGKTGTTNGPTDAWFAGYNRDVVATVWLGFDDNRKIGRGEYGGSAALPMWIEFMQTALKNTDEDIKNPPEGIISVLIDKDSGKQAKPGSGNTIFEYIPESALDSIKSEENVEEITPVDLEDIFQ